MRSTPSSHQSGRRTRGFTLIEIVIVLVLLGGIMALVGPKIFNLFGRANSEQAKIKMTQIESAMDLYKLDLGRYPTAAEGLAALTAAPTGATTWNGPYLKDSKMLKDPWNHDFLYTVSGSKYELKSLGADGKEGGSGEDADIVKGS
jgi:general secretion pathway protein G